MTLYGVEPWGDERADLAAGVQIMHAAEFADKKSKPSIDYMPLLKREEPKPQSEEDMMKILDAACDAMEKREKIRNQRTPRLRDSA